MDPSKNRIIPCNCNGRWLNERLSHRLSSAGSDTEKETALSLWIRDAWDAWGNLYELQSILARAHPDAPGVSDANRALSRVILAEQRLKRIRNQRQASRRRREASSTRPGWAKPDDAEHRRLCHLAALWGDGGSIPYTPAVEERLAQLGARYHLEVVSLHRCRTANPVFYGQPRSVRVVDGQHQVLRRVQGAGVSLLSVFRDPTSRERRFRVSFRHAGGKRTFEVDIPVASDLETVELPKPTPPPEILPPAPQSEAFVDLLSLLASHRSSTSEETIHNDDRFRTRLPHRLLEICRQSGVQLGRSNQVRLGAAACRGWSREEGCWLTEWGVSIVDVDLVSSEVQARFDTPAGQQFVTIPINRIIQGVKPARRVVDGILVLPGVGSRPQLFGAQKDPANPTSPWAFERSIADLRTKVPHIRREPLPSLLPAGPAEEPIPCWSPDEDSTSSFEAASSALHFCFSNRQ